MKENNPINLNSAFINVIFILFFSHFSFGLRFLLITVILVTVASQLRFLQNQILTLKKLTMVCQNIHGYFELFTSDKRLFDIQKVTSIF